MVLCRYPTHTGLQLVLLQIIYKKRFDRGVVARCVHVTTTLAATQQCSSKYYHYYNSYTLLVVRSVQHTYEVRVINKKHQYCHDPGWVFLILARVAFLRPLQCFTYVSRISCSPVNIRLACLIFYHVLLLYSLIPLVFMSAVLCVLNDRQI